MLDGFFISLEGIDFVGKSPIAAWLYNDLVASNLEVVLTRDPPYLLQPWNEFYEFFERGENISQLSEAILLLTARLDNSQRIIKNALSRGAVVISDRYIDSWFAYQSIRLSAYFGGVEKALHFLIELNNNFVNHSLLVEPHMTLWLSDDPHRTMERAMNEQKVSKYENLPMQLKVEESYKKLQTLFPQRIREVDFRNKEIIDAYQIVKSEVFNTLKIK